MKKCIGNAVLLAAVLFGTAAYAQDDRVKVVVIGLDGASWKMITPLLEKGELPNLKKLMDSGVYGNIVTLRGSLSPTIWTSIATGKVPEKHGIRDVLFFDPSQNSENIARSYLRKTKALWNILSENKKKAGVFNWWISYPAEQVNGYIVTNLYQENPRGVHTDASLVYPPGLQLPPLPEREIERTPDVFEKYYAQYSFRLSKDTTTATFLEKKNDVDLFMAYTHVLDMTQHKFWKFMRPEEHRKNLIPPDERQLKLFHYVIPDMYRSIDRWIGELVRNADENTVVIVLSDHGAKDMDETRIYPYIRRILEKFDLGENTVVFEPMTSVYYIKNGLKGREIKELFAGIRTEDGRSMYKVSDSDRKEFTVKLEQQELHSLSIYIRSKLYNIEHEGLCSPANYENSGDHDYDDGIFVMAGKHIKKTGRITGVSVLDVAPTVLYLLGLPVGGDMDGKIAAAGIEQKYLSSHPVWYIESYENAATKEQNPREDKNVAEEELKQKLRSVGYIQ